MTEMERKKPRLLPNDANRVYSLTCESCFAKMKMTGKEYRDLERTYNVVACEMCRMFSKQVRRLAS